MGQTSQKQLKTNFFYKLSKNERILILLWIFIGNFKNYILPLLVITLSSISGCLLISGYNIAHFKYNATKLNEYYKYYDYLINIKTH